MKRFFILNLGLNVTLCAVVGWRLMQPAPVVSEIKPETEVTPTAHRRSTAFNSRASKPPTPWRRIDDPDVRTFMANLRASGCPEQTIKNIVAFRICRSYRERLKTMQAELIRTQPPTANGSHAEWRKLTTKEQNLRDDMYSELESVLGDSWREMSATFTGYPRSPESTALSTDARARLREITKQFRHELDGLGQKAMMSRITPEETTQLRDLERQKQTAIAGILLPHEFEAYLYRNSPAAEYVRYNAPEAKSESEYRAMVKLALDMEVIDLLDGRPDRYAFFNEGDHGEAREQRHTEFKRRLKELLGDERFAESQTSEKTVR